MQYITFSWLCRRKKADSRFHDLPSNRQNPFNITATLRSEAQAMATTPQKALLVKPIFTYGTLDPFDVIIHSIVQFQAKSTCFLLLSILEVSTFWAIPLSVMWLQISAYAVKLQVWYFVFPNAQTTWWVFNVSGIEDEHCTSSGSSGISAVGKQS